MSPGRLMLVVIALVVAGVTALVAQRHLSSQRVEAPPPPPTRAEAPPPEPSYKMVLVARDSVYTGSFVNPDDFEWQEWPDVSVPLSYFVEGERDADELEGAVARRDVGPGQPITEDAFIRPGDRGFLAAVLDPDMRAISVPVDDASSNAGLIFPGDRVDLIVTISLEVDEERNRRLGVRRVSETVLRDVRVIAMGRRTNSNPNEPDDGRARTATLEVSPSQAEKVAVVTDLGKLSLSLRSLAREEDDAESPRLVDNGVSFTWDADASMVLRDLTTAREREETEMTVMRGVDSVTIDVNRGIRP